MKFLIAASTLALMMTPAFSQSSSTSSGSQNSQATQSSSSDSHIAAAQKLKQSLQKEGFTNVEVVAQSFVVQAKSPDGDPVVMTIGPHGMSVFEAMNAPSSGTTTGSSSKSSTGTNSSSSTAASPSAKSNSQK